MVDLSTPYMGDYLKASELIELVGPYTRIPVIILQADLEQVGQDPENVPCVLTLGRASDRAKWPRKLILNKTNYRLLFAVHGKESANWIDKPISIWGDPEVTNPRGERVGGIRVASGHAAPQPSVASGGAIPLPGPAAATAAPAASAIPTPGNGADPIASGAAMGMAGGATVPIPGRDQPAPRGMPTDRTTIEDDAIPI